jgi:hypothetical protein
MLGIFSKDSLLKVKVGDLKVGMYVIMPTSWNEHPFLKNEFFISSLSQIIKIELYGIKFVMVDAKKSLVDVPPFVSKLQAAAETQVAESSQAQSVVPDALYEAIHEKSLTASRRADLVRKNSLLMMDG